MSEQIPDLDYEFFSVIKTALDSAPFSRVDFPKVESAIKKLNELAQYLNIKELPETKKKEVEIPMPDSIASQIDILVQSARESKVDKTYGFELEEQQLDKDGNVISTKKSII